MKQLNLEHKDCDVDEANYRGEEQYKYTLWIPLSACHVQWVGIGVFLTIDVRWISSWDVFYSIPSPSGQIW